MKESLRAIQRLIYALLFTFFLLSSTSGNSQNTSLEEIYTSFKNFTEVPREIIYAHLNKSVYINGETLGFTVYALDKNLKKFSTNTRNVYCTISDENGKILKSKLLLSLDGICYGSFFIDNQFVNGNYTFKAYTNYMKNFEEMNFYIQNFRVVTSKKENDIQIETQNIDAQFLPEGGHLVSDIINSVGVIIKDQKGLGVGQLEGMIYDRDNIEVSKFKTDDFGIARFILKAERQNSYTAKINYKDEDFSIPLPKPEILGISVTLNDFKSRLGLQFKTNEATYASIKDETYQLTFHNGSEIRSIPIDFKNELHVTKLLDKKYLFPGVNIFTLFNSEKRPILERIYFNYDGIELIEAPLANVKNESDSLQIDLQFPKTDVPILQNFSVSILPEETESYLPSHNIISYTYLQPYIRDYLENASYYFTDITEKKQRQLDNLMATKGWSSYDWTTLFNHTPEYRFKFEDGISIKASIPDKTFSSYSVSSSQVNFTIVELDENQQQFTLDQNYPFELDQIYISGLKKNGSTTKPPLYLQFSPSKIPDFENYIKILPRKKPNVIRDATYQDVLETSWTGIELLDEIVLSVNKKQDRLEELTNKEFGKVDVFDDDSNTYLNFAMYLRSKGFTVFDQLGEFIVTIPGRNNGRQASPIFVLDNVQLTDPSILQQMDMSIIDYTVIDKYSTQFSGNSGAGVIKIFTDPTKRTAGNYETTLVLDYPLTFGYSKKFYAPKYSFYQSNFFKKYGVIDWIPKAQLDEKGKLTIKIANRGYKNIVLKLEGSADGQFISQSIPLEVNE